MVLEPVLTNDPSLMNVSVPAPLVIAWLCSFQTAPGSLTTVAPFSISSPEPVSFSVAVP